MRRSIFVTGIGLLLLVGPDGHLVWLWRGNDWTLEDIFEVAEQTFDKEKLSSSRP